MDFDAYSIMDAYTKNNLALIKDEEQIKPNEKIWRISSLTAFIDDDTKILILPVAESRRQVKIQDTKYLFKVY